MQLEQREDRAISELCESHNSIHLVAQQMRSSSMPPLCITPSIRESELRSTVLGLPCHALMVTGAAHQLAQSPPPGA